MVRCRKMVFARNVRNGGDYDCEGVRTLATVCPKTGPGPRRRDALGVVLRRWTAAPRKAAALTQRESDDARIVDERAWPGRRRPRAPSWLPAGLRPRLPAAAGAARHLRDIRVEQQQQQRQLL